MQNKRRIHHAIVLSILIGLICVTLCQCTLKRADFDDNNAENSTNLTTPNDDESLERPETSDDSIVDTSGITLDETKQTEATEVETQPEETKEEIVEPNGGVIYLTFDDGPSLENTPQILDILKAKEVKATFFILNYSGEQEEIVKRQYEEGHTIGLHGYSHDYSVVYSSMDALMNNFLSLQEKVVQTTGGYTSRIIRFPGGSSNTVSKKYCKGIMSQAVEEVTQKGLIYFDWNVSSGDAEVSMCKDADQIYHNTIEGLKPGRENVVLMHDSMGHSATRDVVEKVIDYGKENGYVFKSITEDTVPVKHRVSN